MANIISDETIEYVGANFKNIKLCNWTEGMRFMVMPEKYDLVVGAFCDAKTNRDVSCGKLKHKIMVYKGHSVAKDGTALVNFHCEDDNNDYYYPIPNGTFDDYCYLKLGVPTLAYLGDDGGAAGAGVPGTLLAVQVGQFLPKGGVLDALFQADGFHRRFLLIIRYFKSTSFRRRFPCPAVALAWILVAKPIACVYAGGCWWYYKKDKKN